MGKFDPYSRRQLRLLRREWIRRNRTVLVFVVLGIAVLAALASTWIVLISKGGLQWYLLGAAQVGLAAAGLHILQSGFMAHDREAIWHVRGAWGEDNTRSELKRAQRRRLIWGWVDSINLRIGDLDHVVVTRRGGLVTVDSKWRNTVTPQDITEMAQAATRAKTRTEGVVRTQLRRERGSHRAREQSLRVTTIVVIWGAAQRAMPADAEVAGVRFVAGRELVAYLRSLDGDPVSKHAAHDALERLKNFRSTAWQHA